MIPESAQHEKQIEIERINLLAEEYIESKRIDLKFESKEDRQEYPEIREIDKMIEQCQDQYFLMKKTGRSEQAKHMMLNIIEAKYSKHHLEQVMNLDFTRPTKKLKEQAEEKQIDIGRAEVIEEFKKIQEQNLEDIRRIRDGQKVQAKSKQELERRFEDKRKDKAKQMWTEFSKIEQNFAEWQDQQASRSSFQAE